MNYKTKCITTFLVIIICLSASCGSGGPYLVIKTDKDTRTFGFFEEATGQEITYTKIRYNNREVYKAVFMEILNIAGSNVETGNGVYFAFDEDDYTVEQVDGQTKMTYSGGQSISSGLLWRYTLENGVLSISGKGKKPGPLTVSGRPSEKTLFQKNARATVEGFISSLKEKKYDEVQTFLTDNYDFSGDNVVFDGANYDTYVGLSEFAVAGGEYYTDYAKITVHIKRPDIFDFSNGSDVYDEFHAYTDEEKTAYAAKRFETGDYSMIEDEKVLTLLNEGGKLTIQLDEGLVGLMSQTSNLYFVYDNPSRIGTKAYPSEHFDRKFIREYIRNSVKIENDNGYTIATNEGDLGIVSLLLKKEYRDKNGVLLRTRYNMAFNNLTIFAVYGNGPAHPLIRPGYLWAAKKEDWLYELDTYGADLEKSSVSVFDLEMTRAVGYPELSAEYKEYADSRIAVSGFKITRNTNMYYQQEDGLSGLEIKNTGEREITTIVVHLEFLDDMGTIRYGMGLNILNEGESIKPNAVWNLPSNGYFSLSHVPQLLIEKNKLQSSVIELGFAE